ncbi:MAG: alkaline phosphatase family protein [Promethearchaeota archaeon]
MIRNIIIGIDGGCFESILPLIKKNLLPNFKKIINEGYSAPVQVTVPHATIPSWPCLFSGLEVSELGYYTFIHPTRGIFNSKVWRDKSILSIKDLKIFAINVPGTYPAWPINGEMITGILSPSISCYPKELQEKIEDKWIIEGKNLSEILSAFEMKKNLFLKKIKEDFDLLVFVIRVPDAISHRVLGEKETILNAMNLGYKKIDEFLGEILEEKQFDNLLIFSDHGLKFYNKVLYFPRLLEKKGLLYLNELKGKRINSLILKFYDIIRPLLRVSLSKKVYQKLFNAEKREIERKKDRKLTFFDKSKPKTFIQKLTSNMGALFLFGKDQEKKTKIKEQLEKDKHIDQIFEYSKLGFPDFLIALKDDFIFFKDCSYFLKRNTEVFSHTNRGFFMAYGKNIRKDSTNLINYLDIAPTILKLYDKEKPNYMKGKALNIFKI